MVLAFVLIFSISVPAFATDLSEEGGTGSVTVFLDGKPVSIKYRLENNHITYAEIGNDVMSVHENIVYVNGVAIATIDNTTIEHSPSSSSILRTSWVYTDSCPVGASPSDYSTLYSTKNHNITFIEHVIQYSMGAILAVLITIVPFADSVKAADVFHNVALMIAGLAAGNITFGNSNNVYATEYIYSGGIPFTHKNAFTFFSDSARSNVIGSTTCYSFWA